MRRHILMAALGALALGLCLAPAAVAGDPRCAVPQALIEPAAGLSAVAHALEHDTPVRIVAIGSGTTKGIGATGPAAAYPARLQSALQPRVKASVTMVNLGVQGQTANEMLARLKHEVMTHNPTLVLWETGTVDAVRGVPLDEFTTQLEAGINKLRRAGVDVLLIDPQYARHTARVVNILPFVEVMRTIAGMAQLVLFDRFEVMRHWVDNNIFQLDERAAPRLAAGDIDKVYNCIGELLADVILQAAPKSSHTAAK